MPRLSKIGAAALAAFGWTGITSVTASYLVVAGGASGGGNGGGGGGAGGLITDSVSLNPTLSYTITVGAGGAGGSVGVNGSNSQFGSLTAAVGGGRGGNLANAGSAGGSGGGGGSGYAGLTPGAGGASTAGQGTAGGTGHTLAGSTPSYIGGGGGGGATSAGSNGTQGIGGAGGNGTASSISGSSVTYAGGGGGGGGTSIRAGGTGGGGAGGGGATASTAGTANLGGGGGGGGNPSTNGGSGGSGVVIISYTSPQKFSGGVVTSSGGNTIHTFTTSGTLGPITPLLANYLVVAGGGGGGNADGNSNGGGGGAGGLLSGSSLTIDPYSTYVVTVGAGGSAAASGSNSAFSMVSTAAVGGGYGGTLGGAGASGGSGGGAGGNAAGSQSGGVGTSGQGNNGGACVNAYTGGGGGGAGAAGFASNVSSGAGGAGTASSITGTSVTYAGGGGGNVGAGGAGGGGAGGGPAAAGTANTGGGGGGANGGSGGAGGSGVVIISYPGATQLMAGGVVPIAGANVIHTFNSTGYLTPLTLLNNSLRFRSSASAYLNRTPSSTGNRQKFTWSGWVKRGILGTSSTIFGAYSSGTLLESTYFDFRFNVNSLDANWGNGTWFTTTAVYRDPAAWYHIVLAVDTTQATSSNRLVLYVNGVQVTTFSYSLYPAQNTNLVINTTVGHVISKNATASSAYFDGYMTAINFVDGQALPPTAFGTFNSYGVWQPITYGGSYGNNGFYLPFTNKTSTTTLGYDFSPQGNNWTTNNISLTAGSTYDSMTDVPTLTSATAANYAVINPLDKYSASAITTGNANLQAQLYTLANGAVGYRATLGVSSGKWYWEVNCGAFQPSRALNSIGIDLFTTNISTLNLVGAGGAVTGYAYFQFNGNKLNNGTSVAYGATWTTGDIMGTALDLDAGTITWYKNGVSQGTAFTGIAAGTYAPSGALYTDTVSGTYTADMTYNFGQQPFAYTPPSGYLALNTYNL